MNCMKCGREIQSDAVFCESCMADMEKYPVKPDVVVKLPTRSKADPKKNSTRRRLALTEKEQIALLKRRIRRLYALVAALLVLLGVMGYFAVNTVLKGKAPLPGQNYSTVTTKPQETEAE